MLLVFLGIRAGDEDIVNISVCKGEATKNLIDKALERLRSVAKTERHFQEFEKPEGGCYRCFRDIRWLNGNLVVCSHQIQLRENRTPLQIGREVLNMRNGVAVGLGDVIQRSIVATWTPVSRLFYYHVEWR